MKVSPLPAFALCCALLSPALSLRAAQEEETEVKDLPVAVQKTVHEQVGSLKIVEVEATYEDGQHATEIEYLDGGKKMAIVIGKDGTLIQKELRMSPGDAPAQIKKAVAARYADGQITQLKKIDRSGHGYFELSVKAGGTAHHLKLGANGEPLAK